MAAVDDDGPIDWKRFRSGGFDFVYLNATPGNSVWSQAAAARAAGVEVGAYFFPTIHPSLPPEDEVPHWAVALEEADLPICLDVELPHGTAAVGGREFASKWLHTAWHMLRDRYHHNPLIYSSRRVTDTDDSDTFDGKLNDLAPLAPLWLAQYGRSTPLIPAAWGAGNYWIHQHTGDAHRVAGVRQMDLNRFNYLREGESGNRVRWLQQRLALWDRSIDGVFGARTKAALMAFQTAHALTADGIVGPRTFARLARTQ